MEQIKYHIERMYPYILALIFAAGLFALKINFMDNENMNDVIDGVNTVTALIIGFLGAILPVILGMKNESKIVKYVFEKDENRLFLKYIKSTIIEGLFLVFFNIMLYFRVEIPEKYQWYFFIAWMFFIVCFLLLTCRCLLNMLNLIFMDDSELEVTSGYYPERTKTSEEEEFENEFS